MENKPDFPRRITHEYKPPRSGSDTGAAMIRRHRDARASTDVHGTEPFSGKLVKMNEKELLHGLNDRFAGFIEKVRHLEHQNQLLEREIEEIKARTRSASSLERQYEPELTDLRKLVRDIAQQKHQIEIDHGNLEEELSNVRRQYEKEARSRSADESSIMMLKKDTGDAYQVKVQLEKRAQSLAEEIRLLKESHGADAAEMTARIQDTEQVSVRGQEFGKHDLTAALRDIRAQLEGHAVCDLQQAEERFRSQVARLTEAAETKREMLKATRQEIQEYRRRLQAKNMEMSCAKGTREALEKQLHDVEERHIEDIVHYQDTIKQLENELINVKFDMSGYLREYQDLLNVKMALDVEILSYRKLLEGEETRLSTMSDTHISMPYIYRQSPVYTLPCLSRQGGPTGRAEPQYKFVEEIITETTREIEMSEFEETGSEETVGGDGEQGCVKREGGSSEEEEGADNKDIPVQEGEQVSDSQQNQVESAENAKHGDDDVDAGSPGEIEDGENGDKMKGAFDNKEDTDADKNTHIEVQLMEASAEVENDQQIAKNMKEEIGDAVKAVPAQKGASSKPEDSKPGVPEEGELPIERKETESEDDKKADVLKESKEADVKDSLVTAQAKRPEDETSAQESKEADKPPELSSVVKVQDEALSLTCETVEETSELTAEAKNRSPKETVEQEKPKSPESSSIAPKSEDKEHSRTEPKAISVSETVKDVVEDGKSSQNAADHDRKEQDKELSLKSELKDPSVVEDLKPNSGDKTQTVEPPLPKEKITVEETSELTAEAKNRLPKETVEQEKPKSPESEDKEHSRTEPKAISVPETVKGVVEDGKSSQNAADHDCKEDKELSLKSELKDPSVVEDRTQTVEPPLPKEKITVEETSELTAEAKNRSPKERVEQEKPKSPESSSIAPKSEDKEHSHTEPKAISVPETVKDVVDGKSSQNAADHDCKEQDKELSLKSELKDPSVVEDRTQTVEPPLPKEKITVEETSELTAEVKNGLPKETVEQPESPESSSIAPKSEDKEHSRTEPKAISVSETVKGVVEDGKSSQNAADHDRKEQDKELSLKSELKDPSVVEDKTQTVEPPLPKEKITVEETSELTAEAKNRLPKETVEQEKPKSPESSSIAPKSEDKEHSRTEPKAISVSETVKGVVEDGKSSQNAADHDRKEQDKEVSLKSDLKDPSVVEDKTQTVEPALPKEKIIVAAESTEIKGAAQGSLIQKSETPEESEKITAPEGGSGKVDDVKSKYSGEDMEGMSKEADVAQIKTPPQKAQDISSSSLQQETVVGGRISEVAQVKIENGLSNGAAGVKEEKPDPLKAEAHVESGKEKEAETKNSV